MSRLSRVSTVGHTVGPAGRGPGYFMVHGRVPHVLRERVPSGPVLLTLLRHADQLRCNWLPQLVQVVVRTRSGLS